VKAAGTNWSFAEAVMKENKKQAVVTCTYLFHQASKSALPVKNNDDNGHPWKLI
jgi:hypothetical protein